MGEREGEWDSEREGCNISEVGFATSTRSVEKMSNYFIWGLSKFTCTMYNGHMLPQMYLSVMLEGMYTYVQCIHCTNLECTLYNGHTYTLYKAQIYLLIMWVYTHMYSAYTVQNSNVRIGDASVDIHICTLYKLYKVHVYLGIYN